MVARTFSKPPAARQVEARARSKRLGVRIAVLAAGLRYQTASQSEPGAIHTMQRTRGGWLCSCQGYYHTGCCKHLGGLERRAEREGWDFGHVCPLTLAERYAPVETDHPTAA